MRRFASSMYGTDPTRETHRLIVWGAIFNRIYGTHKNLPGTWYIFRYFYLHYWSYLLWTPVIVRSCRLGSLLSASVFPMFSKVGNKWRYVLIHGGVLSLFVKFSIRKKTSSLNFTYLGEKIWKYGRLKNWAKKKSKLWGKSSPIIYPYMRRSLTRQHELQ